MSSKWLLVALVALVASIALNLAVVGAYIYERRRPPMPPPPPGFARGMRPQMREFMRRMHDRMQPRMDTLREELMATRIGLMELVREPMPDGRADSLLQEIGRIEQEMNRLAFEHARQLIESLPPEARERFLERLEQRGGPGDRPWPRHWGRRPGPHGPGRAHPGGM